MCTSTLNTEADAAVAEIAILVPALAALVPALVEDARPMKSVILSR